MKRFPTRKQATDTSGHFSEIDYMGYSLNTGCETCDGTGYVTGNPPIPVFGDAMEARCCPDCNKEERMPRNVCCHGHGGVPGGEVPPLGSLYRGVIWHSYRGKMNAFYGHLCEQCYQDETRNIGGPDAVLRLIRNYGF